MNEDHASTEPNEPQPEGGRLYRLLRSRLFVPVQPKEAKTLAWSFVLLFVIFASYFIIRPLREAMGISQGARNLPNLFLVTMVAMIVAHLLFAGLVSKARKRSVVPILYRTIVVSLLGFAATFVWIDPAEDVWLARAFYIWVSVYNLFTFSVFWGLMAECFRSQQSKRLFAFIGAGGTTGALVGSGITALLIEWIGPISLLVIAACLLEVGVRCFRRLVVTLEDGAATSDAEPPRQKLLAGSLEGLKRVSRSPYLIGICVFMFLYTFTSSVIYFERAMIVEASNLSADENASLFALRDFAVQALALVGQLFIAGRMIRLVGISAALGFLPLLTMFGFGILALTPTLAVVMVFDVVNKSLNYAVTRPCREMLYTVLDRADKYKAKSFIDTFVYRGGDAVAAEAKKSLGSVKATAAIGRVSVEVIVIVAAGASLVWLITGILLGRQQRRLANE